MDTFPMREKVAECRIAFANANLMIRGQTGHFVMPLLSLMDDMITAMDGFKASSAACGLSSTCPARAAHGEIEGGARGNQA